VVRFAIQPAMERLMEDVRTGTFDYVLTKPGDSLVLVSVRATAVWRLIDVALGGAVITYAMTRGDAVAGPWDVAAFIVGMLAAVVTVYSFLVILSTLSFWFVRLENILVIFQSMYEAGRWPVEIYPGWLRAALTFVVPVAFAVTVPAGALAGRVGPEMLAGAVALAITLAVIARRFWFVGLRHYAGASA
jgi:ABC-2 type transport system permease protein